MMQASDSQAIGAVLRGDRDQYSVLVDKYKKMVYAIAWSHLGDSDLSEDVAQETFIKAYSYLGTLRNPEAFAGWLARIARNVCGTFHRRAKRERAFTQRLGVLESAETVSHEDDRESLEEQLWKSFADLPVVHREALTLFYVEGKSTREAAVALGITEEALRARLFRARMALREQLERRLEDTLDSLQPSKDFTRSVFALLPLSPKGVAGAGGLLAGIGKLLAGLSFVLGLILVQAASMFGIAMWLNRTAQAEIKDTPENQWRKAQVRRGAADILPFVVVICLLAYALPMMLLSRGVSTSTLCAGIAVSFIPALRYAFKNLRVNTGRHALGEALSCTILFAAFCAIGFAHAPFLLTFWPAECLFVVVLGVTQKDKPRRLDYNLFLRAATGGLKEVGEDAQPLPASLTETQMRAFVRFLGERWLVRDYALRNGVLYLVIPAVRVRVRNMLSLTAGSYVAIAPDGTCAARISARDIYDIWMLAPTHPSEEDVQSAVSRAVRYALGCFVRNELAEASAALAGQDDDAIYGRDYERTRSYRAQHILFAVAIVATLVAAVGFTVVFLFAPKGTVF
jgi:RNA polymerase sigma factor (sigma-70 family)